MNRWLGFAIGATTAGAIAYQLYVKGTWADQNLTKDGKLLGLVKVEDGFGFDDIMRGALLALGIGFALKMVRQTGFQASMALPIG
jgi:hypothetical protein